MLRLMVAVAALIPCPFSRSAAKRSTRRSGLFLSWPGRQACKTLSFAGGEYLQPQILRARVHTLSLAQGTPLMQAAVGKSIG